jgi:iron complex outermembrane receptor protein
MSYKLKNAVRNAVRGLAAGAATVALIPGGVFAQESGASAEDVILEEVLVTGSLIRGVALTGSQSIGLDANDVVETGAVTTNELLASVPQIANFFNQRPEQDPRGSDRLTINRPNLRNLPGVNSASGATTLILVDGHRIAPMGVSQSSVDPDVIPGNVIERVAIVPDGGSSLYGADAVGGVINFITRSEFEGVQIDLGFDNGDDYDAWQASLLAGTKWENGSGFISLATTDRDQLLTEDRDWAAQGNWNEEGTVLTPDGTQCESPVGAVTSWFWYGAGWTSNPAAPGAGVTPVGAPCDIKGKAALVPQQERDNVYGAITQHFGDNITLDMKSYFMNRTTTYSSFPRGDTISAPSPADLGLIGEAVGDLAESSAVGFSYAPNSAYRHSEQEVEIETWGITPELTIELPNGWQSRNTLHYGRSENSVARPGSNRTKLVAAVETGLVDPANIAAADGDVIRDILNWETAQDSEQELFFLRSIADGEVMDLPAGKLRAAVGIEYAKDSAKKRSGDVTIGGLSAMSWAKDDRDVTSVFAELSVPVFETLDLSLSFRYDDYSDFGDTTNPNIGFTWLPAEWIKIYGKLGESFNAPTVLDSLGTANGRYIFDAATAVPDPNGERTNASRDDVFLLEGASGALEPQTAEIFALGFEIQPVEGLMLSANYYEIDFKNLLGSPNPQSAQAVSLNPDKFVFQPTDDEWNRFLAGAENAEQFADLNSEDVGVIIDRRISNTEEAKLTGLDFSVKYVHETSFGTMSYGLSGNHQMKFDLTQSGTEVDQLEFAPDLLMSGNIGWSKDSLRARLTFNYTNSYDISPTEAVNQRSVDSFFSTNLFVGYDLSRVSDITKGLSVRFNVDNLFDEEPPEKRSQQNLNYSTTGFTLGRIYKLGLTYKF